MKKLLFVAFIIFISFTGLVIWQYITLYDGKLHIVFCDVGQGDGIFIRTPSGKDILLDGGPDEKVLDCLSSQMPFWDRTIELILLSHPHLDHFAGLYTVIKRYSVLSFSSENLSNTSVAFSAFQKELRKNNIPTKIISMGSVIKIDDGVRLEVLAPDKEFLAKTSPKGQIGESGEFGSLLMLLTYGKFRALFTSDNQTTQLLDRTGAIEAVDVLQVPHHGSRTGLVPDLLTSLSPKLAVISVGERNRYGHPHKEVLAMLAAYNIATYRTDRNGTIKITTDGSELFLKKD